MFLINKCMSCNYKLKYMSISLHQDRMTIITCICNCIEELYLSMFFSPEHIYFYVRTNQINLRQLAIMLRKANTLNYLDLSGMNIGRNEMKWFVPSLHKVVYSLNLGYNHIGPNGTDDLFHGITSSKICVLDLTDNAVGIDGAISISNAFSRHSFPSLTCMNLQNNIIGSMGIEHLAQALQTFPNSITELNVSNNQLRDTGAIAVASIPNLKIVTIGSNFITHIGAEHLAANRSYTHLDIRYNLIDSIGANAFITSQSKKLISLELWGNRIGIHEQRKIHDMVFCNKIRLKIPKWVQQIWWNGNSDGNGSANGNGSVNDTTAKKKLRLPSEIIAEIITMGFLFEIFAGEYGPSLEDLDRYTMILYDEARDCLARYIENYFFILK